MKIHIRKLDVLNVLVIFDFKGLTPILGSAAAQSCTGRQQQSCTEDEDEAGSNSDEQMTEDSHAEDDLTVPPPPSPPCTCGKNLELPPTPPLDDLESAATKNPFTGKTTNPLFHRELALF